MYISKKSIVSIVILTAYVVLKVWNPSLTIPISSKTGIFAWAVICTLLIFGLLIRRNKKKILYLLALVSLVGITVLYFTIQYKETLRFINLIYMLVLIFIWHYYDRNTVDGINHNE